MTKLEECINKLKKENTILRELNRILGIKIDKLSTELKNLKESEKHGK